MESIQGLVEHIVYHNDTNGYTVFSMMWQGEEIVCVGTATSLDEGEYLKAEGEYIEHQVYGTIRRRSVWRCTTRQIC